MINWDIEFLTIKGTSKSLKELFNPIETNYYKNQIHTNKNVLAKAVRNYSLNLKKQTIKMENKLQSIIEEIIKERIKQDAKWGVQNHPILDQMLLDRSPQRMCKEYELPTEEKARQMCEIHAERKDLTYMHILIEEISEAASCGNNVENLRKELIQSAAVLVAMIESLDRNKK